MTQETLTGKQVLALLAQDEVPEIEYRIVSYQWCKTDITEWGVSTVLNSDYQFRIKPTPARRIRVTLADGEVVSWPEPVRKALNLEQDYWFVDIDGRVIKSQWEGFPGDRDRLVFGNVHLTLEAAQEYAGAWRKINTRGGV